MGFQPMNHRQDADATENEFPCFGLLLQEIFQVDRAVPCSMLKRGGEAAY